MRLCFSEVVIYPSDSIIDRNGICFWLFEFPLSLAVSHVQSSLPLSPPLSQPDGTNVFLVSFKKGELLN